MTREVAAVGPDTIAAIATPPGRGAVALLRISGPRALQILGALSPGRDWTAVSPRTAILAEMTDPDGGDLLDRTLVTVFPGPASYTGEDVVEITGHGGAVAPRLILEAALRAGAREAEAGEFTRRAYLHGKLDLVQAEAVLDLVESRHRALHRVAVHQLDRGLSQRVSELRESVVGLEALLAHHLDFPEEDEPPTPVSRIAAEGSRLADALDALGRTAPEGVLLRQGARVVLAGAPNVGKSSLFNALAGEDRALVTEIPGTTRDALEAEVSLGGYPFRLVDTAGLRDTAETVERLGIEVARRHLATADVVLLCVEAGRALSPEEAAFRDDPREARLVLVRTKADRAGERADGGDPPPEPEGREGAGDGADPGDGAVPEIPVSALRGTGLDRLRDVLAGLVFRGIVEGRSEMPVLTRERQARAVQAAGSEARAFVHALQSGVPPEVASAHLKSVVTHLEEVVGMVTGDDVLDHLFRQFCIGK